MKRIVQIRNVMSLVLVLLFLMIGAEANAGLKGIIIYDSKYGSTPEVATGSGLLWEKISTLR